MKVNPVRIYGRWKSGFALDRHTLSSVYIGDDEFGNPQFETTRTEVGEALYQLKYKGDQKQVPQLADAAVRFLKRWKPQVDLIVTVPPSNASRKVQPVLLVAAEIAAQISVALQTGVVFRKGAATQIKNVHDPAKRQALLEGAFTVDESAVANRGVLLFDDLFRSGATMNELAGTLIDKGKVKEVFALTLTKTSRNQ